MPSKNEDKIYIENSYYHLYNRGVEKRTIFQDEKDYATFLSYIKAYLLPKEEKTLRLKLADPKLPPREKDKVLRLLRLNNFNKQLTLVAYCLMTNHFHLLIYQTEASTIDSFMNSLITRYSMYFNKKYKRVGPLFQGTYKGLLVDTDEQLLHLSRYIHVQAIVNSQGETKQRSQPSSYPNYLGRISQEWVKPDRVLEFFSNTSNKSKEYISYDEFIHGSNNESESILHDLLLD